jgi:uncharacterized protein (DUF1330 family)
MNMSVFLIADIKVTDDGWVPEYAANVHRLVEKHGGRYLSRSGNIDTLEGDMKDSTLIAILEFPSRAALYPRFGLDNKIRVVSLSKLPQIPPYPCCLSKKNDPLMSFPLSLRGSDNTLLF